MFKTVPPIMLALEADEKWSGDFHVRNSESSTYDQSWMHNNYCVLQKDYCYSSATVVPERLWSRPRWSWNQRPCSAVNHQVGILGELKSSTSLMVEIQIEEQEKEQEALDKLDKNIATISSLTINRNLLPYMMNSSCMTWKMIMTTWSYIQNLRSCYIVVHTIWRNFSVLTLLKIYCGQQGGETTETWCSNVW